MSERATLRAFAARLVDPRSTVEDLADACDGFYRWAMDGALPTAATVLPSGLAISPADAAACTLDAPRTAAFVRALDAALAGRPHASVLYAGCGPLAPIALLAASLHADAAPRITLVDVHAASLEQARRLFERVDLVVEARCEDAATMRCDDAATILVAEVMQAALAREPQWAVMANLVPQCATGVDVIPARVAVGVAVAPIDVIFGEQPLETIATLVALIHGSAGDISPVDVVIPRDTAPGCHAALVTHVDAGHGHVVAPRASGLTQPVVLAALGCVTPGETLTFRYRTTGEPGFDVTR